jgi:ribonuclease HI
MKPRRRRVERVVAYADGAIGNGRGPAAVGAVVLDRSGRVLRLGNRRVRRMTNNEAEYAGLLLALELALTLRPEEVCVYLDSEVVVGQMTGRCGVRASSLKPWHRQACHIARKLPAVTYTHVPRERNQLADALANEALQGKLLHLP